MGSPTVKNIIKHGNWWVEAGLHDDDGSVLTWVVCGGCNSDGNGTYIAEFESKTLAAHVAKIHNRTCRKAKTKPTKV